MNKKSKYSSKLAEITEQEDDDLEYDNKIKHETEKYILERQKKLYNDEKK